MTASQPIERVVTGPLHKQVVWRVAGTGPVLILLHGGYGSWTHWVRNIEPLADFARVLVPDMPGYGESDDPDDLADHVSIANPIMSGIDELLGSTAQFNLAAFSFGANIAGQIGLTVGDRLKNLVLVGAGGLKLPRPPSVDLKSWRNLSTAAEQAAAHHQNLVSFMFYDPQTATAETVALQAANAARARVKSRPISRRGALHDALGKFPASLHGIWGEQDVTASGFLQERKNLMRQADPRSTFLTIPNAGHWVQYEAARDVNTRIRKIIEPLSAPE